MATTASVSIGYYFQDLPDPRRQTQNTLHLLSDLLVIALCATIAGCDSSVAIAEYGRQKESWLRRFLRLPHGIPSHDTFSRVLAALDPRKFHDCFVRWVGALHEVTQGQIVAIDGKTLRRSFDKAKGLPPLHVVSAWAAENRLVLGEVAVDGKSNEITAIPKLLELLELTGAIVTVDALGCQKDIAAQIRARGADYVLAVKDNQPHLHADLAAHFEGIVEAAADLPRRQRYHTKEVNRGRVEERWYYATPLPEGLRHAEAWCDLTSVGWVVSLTQRDGQELCEARGYISSLLPDAKQLARAVRGHWGIENGQHWILDVVFAEDQARARAGHEAENLGLLRRLALNLLRREETKMPSVRVKRHAAGWNDDLMLRILTAGTT
jgi:predicted transposase YbfD/YdcC